ncbi:MAG: serine/threonine-protein kinase [Myxococcota bacterium]|jgi:serine/threonine-protein kinase|nr:serine/threonine-protein kinase [Myxococcota bacterium]
MGRYRIIDLLGRGGHAEIYLARVEGEGGFSKPVALKRQRGQSSPQTSSRRALLAEARLNALLDHPNIASVYDIFEEDGELILVMEYLHGLNLRQLCQQLYAAGQLMPVAMALHIGAELLAGLAHAHSARDERGSPLQLIHRDVSPENVFLCANGSVKLTDFGIARSIIAPRDTRIGVVRGKARYLSPEQARGEELEVGTDVFAIGLVLYELLTGVPALEGDSERELMLQTQQVNPATVLQYRQDVHERVLTILALALAPHPSQRYPSAQAMARDLRAVLSWLEPSYSQIDLKAFLDSLCGPMLEQQWRRIWQDQSTQVAEIISATPSNASEGHTSSEHTRGMALGASAQPENERLSKDEETGASTSQRETSSAKEGAKSKTSARRGVDLESLRRAINEAYDPEEK